MHLNNKAIGGLRRRNASSARALVRASCGRMLQMRARMLAAVIAGPLVAGACAPSADETPVPVEHSLDVTASAYNSTRAQTNDNPTLTAWGDTLAPGMRVIAVSRDLIPLGLGHGVAVRIEGLDGEYVVRDKMAARWEKKIDIYMGNDVAAARQWGKKELTIYWLAE